MQVGNSVSMGHLKSLEKWSAVGPYKANSWLKRAEYRGGPCGWLNTNKSESDKI